MGDIETDCHLQEMMTSALFQRSATLFLETIKVYLMLTHYVLLTSGMPSGKPALGSVNLRKVQLYPNKVGLSGGLTL